MSYLFEKHFSDIEFYERGVLDNLSESEMKYFKSEENSSELLISRLTNSNQILLDPRKIEKKIDEIISESIEDGFRHFLVLCTGKFNNLKNYNANIYFPDDIITPLFNKLFKKKKLGVLIPNENQTVAMNEKWKDQHDVIIRSASPYLKIEDIVEKCHDLEIKGAEAILMDCMGYGENMKAEVEKSVQVPIILSNVLVMKIVSELI